MSDIIIDLEFSKLCPPLSQEEYLGLVDSIVSEGCRDLIDIWHNIIIDGHNRYKICKQHKIPYKTREITFIDRDKAKIWIIGHQLARRNITLEARSYLRGKQYELRKKTHGGQIPGSRSVQNVHSIPIRTVEVIADEYGVSDQTIKRDEKYTKAIDILEDNVGTKTREKILSGNIKIAKDDVIELSQKSKAKQKQIIDKLVENPKKYKEYKTIKKEEEQEKRKETIKQETALPNGKYHVIYADPPWQYRNADLTWSAERQYSTMSIEELMKLPIKELLEENAILFMWITNPILVEGIPVLNAWGFEYKSNFVWIKEKAVPGFFVNGQHELLLIATKGQMQPLGNKISSIIKGETTKHSQKPEIVYKIIEDMFPDTKRLELFARNKKEGWESWGNQI